MLPGKVGFFLGRQPILDCRQEIVGYELLFRSSDGNTAEVVDHEAATASVILNTLSRFGLNQVLGDKLGFINVDRELLFSESLELLPCDKTVLELLEFVNLDDQVRQRCVELKDLGFRLSLDDHLYSPENEDLYHIMDIVKLDVMETPSEDLPRIVEALQQVPTKLLAEKVETADDFEIYKQMGFEYFQGYFFQRPEVLKRTGLSASHLEMLQLFNVLTMEVDIDEVEEKFKKSPSLSFQLLTLVNSVSSGTREKIKSLRHAIILLGIDRLRRWAQLALFSAADNRGIKSPLLEMAAVRAHTMEDLMILRHGLPRGSEPVEAAFMTGILSMLDRLFETSMDVVIAGLDLSEEVAEALSCRVGELGQLLSLTEMQEQMKFDAVEELLAETGVTSTELLGAQLNAYNWRGMAAAA